jgi:hypothetical protein
MKLRRGKDEPEEKLEKDEERRPTSPRLREVKAEEGSRFAALWLLLITVLMSLLFMFFG